MTLSIADRQRIRFESLQARPRRARSPNRARPKQHDGADRVLQRPGSLPQRYLCSWICRRTGSRSASIQSASCRAGSCSWLGENSTPQRSAELETLERRATPVVVGAIADHEFDLLLRAQQRQLVVAIAVLLARAGCLDVDDPHHARIDCIDRHGAAGLERYPIAGIGQRAQQLHDRLSAPEARRRSRRRSGRRAHAPAREWHRAPTSRRRGTHRRCRSIDSAADSRSGARTRSEYRPCRPRPAASERSR